MRFWWISSFFFVVLTGSAFAISPAEGPFLEHYQHLMNCKTRLARREKVKSLFDTLDSHGDDYAPLITRFAEVTELSPFFTTTETGTIQNYSLVEHYLRMFAVWKRERAFLPSLNTSEQIRFSKWFPAVILLHDSGKPVAVELGDKKQAPKFTVPLTRQFATELGFSSFETNLMVAIVSHDIIGEVVTSVTSVAKAKFQLEAIARSVPIDPKEFFKLQTFFFSLDASSYPNVRQAVFEESERPLVIKNIRFKELEDLMLGK